MVTGKLKLIIGLLMLALLSMPIACAQPTQVPEAEPEPTQTPEPWLAQIPALPAEDAIIEMSTVGTMSGMVKCLTISENGLIVYIEEEGPRIVLPGSSRSRTTKTGQLQDDELDRLLEMIDACPFDTDGKCQANTKTMDTDVDSRLYIHYQGTTRIIVSDYQPLYPEVTELMDVPEPVRTLYHELWYIVENRTSQVSREEITKGE